MPNPDATPFRPHTAEYERLAESMGMDLQAFKAKYLTDPPFHALVVVHFAQERELREALRRRDEVIDIAKLHSVCWTSLTSELPEDWERCGSCGGCLLFKTLVEFDRHEALLAQPAAVEEGERG